MNNDYIICYDGVCNFCNFWVSLLIKYDKKKRFKYLWLQSQTATKLLAKSTLTPADLNTIIYLRKGKVITQSAAIIKIISLSLFTFSPRDLAESSESESILILFE